MSERIDGTHHITLSTGGAQEDWDFHTRTLGLRPIKKTMLYDGEAPVYHLYYANADMDAGSILTTFPMRQQGKLGRRGSNQVKEIGLSVDESSIDFWADRLAELHVATEHSEVLGTKRLTFAHPCGIPYTLVGTTGDTRRGHEAYGVPGEHGIKGAYAPIVSVIDPEEMLLYLQTGMGADKIDEEGDRHVVEIAGEGLRGRGGGLPPWRRERRRGLRRARGVGPGAEPPPGDVALRRGHAAPLGLERGQRGQPDGAEGVDRGTRVHRRDRAEG